MEIKKFNNFLFEDDSTTGTVGSNSFSSAPSTNSYVSAAGVSISGGGSGSAFSTNSNCSGMGPVVSAEPSNIPGDVTGSSTGSGDVGSTLGVFTKRQANARRSKDRTKDKSKRRNSKIAKELDQNYTTQYKEKYNTQNKLITSWKTFNEELEKEKYNVDKIIDYKDEEILSYKLGDLKRWEDKKVSEDINIISLPAKKGKVGELIKSVYIEIMGGEYIKLGNLTKWKDDSYEFNISDDIKNPKKFKYTDYSEKFEKAKELNLIEVEKVESELKKEGFLKRLEYELGVNVIFKKKEEKK